jgi:hypothetical protein
MRQPASATDIHSKYERSIYPAVPPRQSPARAPSAAAELSHFFTHSYILPINRIWQPIPHASVVQLLTNGR